MAMVARGQSLATASQATDDDRDREHAGAAGHKDAPALTKRLLRIGDVLEGIRVHHEVERLVREWKLRDITVRVERERVVRQT